MVDPSLEPYYFIPGSYLNVTGAKKRIQIQLYAASGDLSAVYKDKFIFVADDHLLRILKIYVALIIIFQNVQNVTSKPELQVTGMFLNELRKLDMGVAMIQFTNEMGKELEFEIRSNTGIHQNNNNF